MNFSLNLKALLQTFPLPRMNGQEKFLAVAASIAGGNIGVLIQTSDIKSRWPKAVLGFSYNRSFYERAQIRGWLNPASSQTGMFLVTQAGIDHLTAISSDSGTDHATDTSQRSGHLI